MNRAMLFVVLAYVVVIYLTLPLGRVMVNSLYELLGRDNFSLVVNGLGVVIVGVVLGALLKNRKAFLIALPLLLFIGIVSVLLERPEERIHFIQYGLLGALVYKTFLGLRRASVLSIAFVFVAGAIDELIQAILPNRVGDIRDVVMNAVGGFAGVWLGRLYWSS